MAPLPIGMFQILSLANGCFSGSRTAVTAVTVAASVAAGAAGTSEMFATVGRVDMTSAVFGSGVLELPQAASMANTGVIIHMLALGDSRVKVFTATFLMVSRFVMFFDAKGMQRGYRRSTSRLTTSCSR
jgi:hypothetical protein